MEIIELIRLLTETENKATSESNRQAIIKLAEVTNYLSRQQMIVNIIFVSFFVGLLIWCWMIWSNQTKIEKSIRKLNSISQSND